MLTATYSLVAIAAEQDKTRSLLHRLQQFIETSWKGLQSIDFNFLDSGYKRLVHFDHHFRNRKLELYLIPALKGISREADMLIAELELLSTKAAQVLHSAGHQLAATMQLSRVQVSQLCDTMHTYCLHVESRLNLEEQALLPLARRTLSVDDWFGLAAQFLSRDCGRRRRRARSQPSRTAGSLGSSSDIH